MTTTDEFPYWHSPEEEADFNEFCRMADRWDWTWSVVTRGDIDVRIYRHTTDEEWAEIRHDHHWTSIGDGLDEYVGDFVHEVIDKFNLEE